MRSFSKLLVDQPAPLVLRLLINRTDKRNAIDYEVRQQLTEALTALSADAGTRALVLGGAGGHFSAGGDLPSMAGLSEAHARERMQHIARLCRLVWTLRIPVVTAMEGVSAGGCIGLALLGDHIVVGESTRILFPFMKLGLVPDWGTLYTLPRRVGLPETRRFLTLGAVVSAAEARRVSLADELVADADVMPTAVRRAAELASLPGNAFARMKWRLNHRSPTFDEEMQREEEDQAALLRSADFLEGYAAFKESRDPDFIRSGADGK